MIHEECLEDCSSGSQSIDIQDRHEKKKVLGKDLHVSAVGVDMDHADGGIDSVDIYIRSLLL